jgi:hypothetical protein
MHKFGPFVNDKVFVAELSKATWVAAVDVNPR